jgi:hypothetical protein
MSSVTPQVLTALSGSTWSPDEYRHRSSISGYEIYDRWSASLNNWFDSNGYSGNPGGWFSIKVGTDVNSSDYNTWIDHGTIRPDSPIVENSDGTISLFNGTTLVYKFTKPTTASWISSSGGGTGGGSPLSGVVTTEFTKDVPTGVIPVDDIGSELYYTIAASEASGNYYIYNDDVYHATMTHTSGTVTAGQTPGRYYATNTKLYDSSMNLLAEFTWPSKVACNFW